MPDSKLFIFGASDAHAAAQWQIDDTVDYIRGFRDVLSGGRAGHYGFRETQLAVRAANMCSGFWRCGSEPSTPDKQWVNFWQRNAAPTTKVVSGVVCDINELYRYPTQEDNMPLNADDKAAIRAIVQDVMRYGVMATPHPGDINRATGQPYAVDDPAVFVFGGTPDAPGGRNPMDIVLDTRDRAEAMQAALTDIALKVAAGQSVPIADLVAGVVAGLLPDIKAQLVDVQNIDEDAVAVKLDQLIAARFAQ